MRLEWTVDGWTEGPAASLRVLLIADTSFVIFQKNKNNYHEEFNTSNLFKSKNIISVYFMLDTLGNSYNLITRKIKAQLKIG